MTATEPEFVGAGRRAVVDGLLRTYDLVRDTGWPQWVVLEAPSGWGKTRIAREFYARLAAERQTDPAYWPPGILESLAEGADTLSARRKRVFPHVTHNPGSLPDFMWWGIACATRDGLPTVALAEDLDQLRAHADYLEDAWRRNAPRAPRIAQSLTSFGAVAADEIVMEGVGTAAEALLGAAVPGLGLVRWLGERTVTALRDAGARRDRLRGSESITAKADLADDTVAMVSRLALPDLPLVVFVEDLHDADASLSDLLAQLASRPGAVLIVTTSWPGSTAANPHVAEAMRAAADRVLVLDHRGTRPPAPFPAEASLAPLTEDALAAIVRFRFPSVDAGTLARIVARYTNPLALELFCELPRVRRRARDGVLTLSAETISESPAEIRGLYRELWNELPEPLREALSLAALGAPSTIGASGASAQWNAPLLLRALESLDWPTLPEVAAALGSDADAYSWVREVSSMLRAFHEPDQLAVAADDDTFLVAEDRVEVRTALAAALADLAVADALPTDDAVHLAEVATVLAAEGFLTDGAALARAVRPALDVLSDQPREADRVIAIADRALPDGDLVTAQLSILEYRANAKLERGDAAGALVDARRLVEAPAAAAFPEFVLRTRQLAAAALAATGRVGEAIADLRQVRDDCVLELGPTHTRTMHTRNEYAKWLADAGRVQEAADEYLVAIDILTLDRPRDDPAVLPIRNNLALTLNALGRHADAAEELDGVARSMAEHHGPDALPTLIARVAHAVALSDTGVLEEPIAIVADVVESDIRVLGPDHPKTLQDRGSLAQLISHAGRSAEAMMMAQSVLTDSLRVLGPTHAHTRAARSAFAGTLSDLGRDEEALVQYELVADQAAATLGEDHPSTLSARSDIAIAVDATGDVGRVLALLEPLVERATHALGAAHSLTLKIRHNAANALRASGRPDEASAALEALLAQLTQQRTSDDVLVMMVRASLGRAWCEAGRHEAALVIRQEVLADRRRVLGSDHPRTLSAWASVAIELEDTGRSDEAYEQWTRVVEARTRIHGATHPETLLVRSNLAFCAASVRGYDESIELHRAVLADRVTTLGPEHPESILSRSNLGATLTGAGRPHEAIEQLEPAAVGMAQAMGVDHPTTLRVRGQLVRALREADRHEEADAALVALLGDRTRVLGVDHPDRLADLETVAQRHGATESHDAAVAAFGELLAVLAEIRPADDPWAIRARTQLAHSLNDSGRSAEALPHAVWLAEQAVRTAPDARETFLARDIVATTLLKLGHADEAADAYGAILEDTVRALGADHIDVPACVDNLAAALIAANRVDEAIELRRSRIDALRTQGGSDVDALVLARDELGFLLLRADQAEEAVAIFSAVLDETVALLGPEHPDVRICEGNLTRAREAAGRGAATDAD